MNLRNQLKIAKRNKGQHKIRMGRREYREFYLKSEHWQQLRAKAIIHYTGYGCAKCGAKNPSDVHHKRYRNLYDVTVADLCLLCRPCHEFVENAKRLGYLDKDHSLEELRAVTPESIAADRKRKREKVVLYESFCHRLNKTNSVAQRFVCGILKRTCPSNFTVWVNTLVTRDQLHRCLWAMDKVKPRHKKKGSPYGGKRTAFAKQIAAHHSTRIRIHY